jgi:hypothetical protein
MTVSFALPLTEHYRAYRAAFHRQPSSWIAYGFFGLLPVVILLAGRLARGLPWSVLWAQNWNLIIWGPLFVLVGAPLLHLMNVRALRAGNRTLAGEQSYAFSQDGFRTWGPLFNTSLLWGGVDRVVETRRYLFIYVSAAAAYFIPLSAIAPAELQDLRQLLHAALGSRAAMRSDRGAAA